MRAQLFYLLPVRDDDGEIIRAELPFVALGRDDFYSGGELIHAAHGMTYVPERAMWTSKRAVPLADLRAPTPEDAPDLGAVTAPAASPAESKAKAKKTPRKKAAAQ